MRNVVRVIPKARAVLVMRAAKALSLPEMFSAMVAATSFAERVTKALMAFSTAKVSPGFSPSLEGGREAPCAVHFSAELSLSLSAFSSSKRM